MRCRTRALFVWLLWLAVFPVADVAAVEMDTHGMPHDFSIGQLADQDYSRRQAATVRIWQLRDQSRQAVIDAVDHPDPEIAERARWVLRQWRRGSLPDTPPQIARLLESNDDPAVLEELMEFGQFHAVAVAIEESADAANRDLLSQRLSARLAKRFPIFVRQALANDATLDLLRLVDLCADSPELAVCRIDLMRELGLEVEDVSLLPTSSQYWTPGLRQQAEVTVLFALGRTGEALQRAIQSGDRALVRTTRMLAGEWPAIATDAFAAATDAKVDSVEATYAWCDVLIAADRCGDDAMRDQAVEALKKVADNEEETTINLRWKCLASHGFVEDAIAILRSVDPDSAAMLGLASSRTQLAFDILDYPPQEIDTKLTTWIDSALSSQGTSESLVVHPEINRLLSLMRCLLSVGRDSDAWQIAVKLSDSPLMIGQIGLREYVLQALIMTNQNEWLPKLAVRLGENEISSTSQRFLILALSDMDVSTWRSLTSSLEQLLPSISFARRIEIAFLLASGETIEEFGSDEDFEKLYQELVSGHDSLPPSVRSLLVQRTASRYLSTSVASFFSRHGQGELALRLLHVLKARRDIKAIGMIAEEKMARDRADSANEAFDEVWKYLFSEASPDDGLRLSSDDMEMAVKAMVAQWVIAQRQGYSDTSAQAKQQIRLTLCSPSTELRRILLRQLAEYDDEPMVLDAYQVLMTLAAFGDGETTGLYDVTRDYATLVRKTDPAAAAVWFDIAVGGTQDSTNYHPLAYVSLPVFVRRWFLEAAIQQNDVEKAKEHLERIAVLNPMDIDVAERLLPRMGDKPLMSVVADRAFDRIWEFGSRYVETYPFNTTAANNLAWVAAMNKKRLSDAQRIAEQAVFFEPDSAVFRDTLAEILFLQGKTEEALQIEKACLLDDPGQWHLHQQVKKYMAALAE